MTTEKHLELLIAASVWPDANTRDAIWRDLHLPALSLLYGKSGKSKNTQLCIAAKLAACFGLQEIPVAPVLLAKLGRDIAPGYWLCVDPVTLRVDRDHLTLLGEPYLNISDSEATALVAALNQLYQADGYEFVMASARRWFVRFPSKPNLQFTPLKEALGRNLNEVLPTGETALQFSALLNEMQMLLYAHPVNDARDAAGQLLINSVWIWGGGEYPARVSPSLGKPVFGGDELVQALSQQKSTPAQFSDLSDLNAIVVLDDLELHAVYGAGYEWQQVWLRWEASWFAPALAALKAGQVDRITLHFSDVGEVCSVTKSDLWRFWRKADLPRYLNEMA
ncbi:hypothetical protein NT239_00730 [Chitinibacter sp. SCUT-21]|uniref:hypothetical protein n=1 Tax=Chitinibacter sp. SCUT-21 TaxID=2970891 RepID=UPI0035A64A29